MAVGKKVDVISISLGIQAFIPEDYAKLKPVFDKAKEQGTYIIIGAGNKNKYIQELDSYGPLATLAREYNNAILVQASDNTGKLADFSQRGEITAPGTDIIAPIKDSDSKPGTIIKHDISDVDGNQISSTTHTVNTSEYIRSGYDTVSGTSFAGPLVAGCISLALSVNPELKSNPDLMFKMLKTSEKYNHGYGVNAWYMVLMALQSRISGMETDFDQFLNPRKNPINDYDY